MNVSRYMIKNVQKGFRISIQFLIFQIIKFYTKIPLISLNLNFSENIFVVGGRDMILHNNLMLLKNI